MTLKTTLIGGAAVGAMLAAGMVGTADAKTVRRHHRVAEATGPSKSEAELKSEVETLKTQVHELESRLDAQAQATQQTQAQVQTAQNQAQAAQTTAQAAQTQVAAQESQIETIPAQVESDTNKKIAPLLTGWFNDTKVGGTIFADFSSVSNRSNGYAVGSAGAIAAGNSQAAQNGVSYDIKRAYISIDHKFNSVFSADITTDFTYDSVTKASQLYIKKAYLQANLLGSELVVRGGSADMPWVPFVEGLYGYRYVDHVLIDNYSYGTSADWGLHAFGNLWDNHIGYAVSVVDGQGYKVTPQGTIATSESITCTSATSTVTTTPTTPTTTTTCALTPGTSARTHGVDVEYRLNANFDNVTVAVGGYDGHRGTSYIQPTFYVAQRFDALAAYTSPLGRIGVEYLWAHYWNDVTQTNPAKTNTTEGVSAFASVNFTKQFSLFGRYDYLKPQEDTAPHYDSNFFNVGLAYKPTNGVDLALVYKHESVIDGVLSTSNGSIGATNPGKGTYNEVGIFTGVKF